jgi:hypothetical protein
MLKYFISKFALTLYKIKNGIKRKPAFKIKFPENPK